MAENTDTSKLDFRRKFKGEISKVTAEEQRLADEGAPIQDNVWNLYEGVIEEYDGSFSEILKSLNFESFQDWMKKRKESGLSTHILDVMGGNGSFLRDISGHGYRNNEVSPYFDKSLEITLADESLRKKKRQEENARKGVSTLAGDITSGKTWYEVSKWLRLQGIPAFDLVICRGVDGIDLIPVPLYRKLLDELYTRTTNKDGLILSQVSYDADKKIDDWNNALNNIQGIKSYAQHSRMYSTDSSGNVVMNYYSFGGGFPAVGIIKSSNSPVSLRPFTRELE